MKETPDELTRTANEGARKVVAQLDNSVVGNAVDYLRRKIPALQQAELRGMIRANPDEWWVPIHFHGGMSIRNLLREGGFGEKELGIGNLDDVYTALVEIAFGDEEQQLLSTGYHVYTGLGQKCSWMCRIYCALGTHRWSYPGGECECCGEYDGLFNRDRKK